MANRNRTAGHSWERKCCQYMQDIGFTKACTSRSESRNRDNQKVDLCFTEPYNIQSKCKRGKVDYHKILSEMPDEEDNINVIYHKMVEKSGSRFMPVEEYAILKLGDFLKIIENK